MAVIRKSALSIPHSSASFKNVPPPKSVTMRFSINIQSHTVSARKSIIPPITKIKVLNILNIFKGADSRFILSAEKNFAISGSAYIPSIIIM